MSEYSNDNTQGPAVGRQINFIWGDSKVIWFGGEWGTVVGVGIRASRMGKATGWRFKVLRCLISLGNHWGIRNLRS